MVSQMNPSRDKKLKTGQLHIRNIGSYQGNTEQRTTFG